MIPMQICGEMLICGELSLHHGAVKLPCQWHTCTMGSLAVAQCGTHPHLQFSEHGPPSSDFGQESSSQVFACNKEIFDKNDLFDQSSAKISFTQRFYVYLYVVLVGCIFKSWRATLYAYFFWKNWRRSAFLIPFWKKNLAPSQPRIFSLAILKIFSAQDTAQSFLNYAKTV